MSRKEREKLLRKKEIINAALKLFSVKGYKATTLDEIAEVSEFGKGTIYNYFSSKEDIYREIISSTLEVHNQFIFSTEKEKESLYDFIYEIIKQLLVFSYKNREAYLLMVFTQMHLAESTPPEISKLMSDHQIQMNNFFIKKAKEAIKNEEIRKVDPERTIRFFRGIFFHYIYEMTIKGSISEDIVEEEARFLADIVFNGIKNN